MALRCDSPIVVQWRGGHTDFNTTRGYLDRGRVEARHIGQPLPPLPPDLLTSAPSSPQRDRGEVLPEFCRRAKPLTPGTGKPWLLCDPNGNCRRPAPRASARAAPLNETLGTQLALRASSATPTGIEIGYGVSRKLSAGVVLADNSRKALEEPLPFGPVGCRPVPARGAELRQPDGNAESASATQTAAGLSLSAAPHGLRTRGSLLAQSGPSDVHVYRRNLQRDPPARSMRRPPAWSVGLLGLTHSVRSPGWPWP
jgi:hypothetical protein